MYLANFGCFYGFTEIKKNSDYEAFTFVMQTIFQFDIFTQEKGFFLVWRGLNSDLA